MNKNKTMKHLYIIGNGFDIHHEINSSYSNFRDWMESNYPSILEDVENVYGYCDADWWAVFATKVTKIHQCCTKNKEVCYN